MGDSDANPEDGSTIIEECPTAIEENQTIIEEKGGTIEEKVVDAHDGQQTARDVERLLRESENEHIIRAYNVPVEFTVSKLEDLIKAECPSVKLRQIISPSLWEDKLDTSWKVLCANRKSYETLLAKEDIWLFKDRKEKLNQAVTFVPGDSLDIAHIPSKADEQMLVNAYTNEVQLERSE